MEINEQKGILSRDNQTNYFISSKIHNLRNQAVTIFNIIILLDDIKDDNFSVEELEIEFNNADN